MDDAATDAFRAGLTATAAALRRWRQAPLPVLGGWLAASAGVAVLLLALVAAIGAISPGTGPFEVSAPPFAVGGPGDVVYILRRNLLVLALHSLACVAGFIAGSSLPRQASGLRGFRRAVHTHGARLAIGFVVLATGFSLTVQALSIGARRRAGRGGARHLAAAPAVGAASTRATRALRAVPAARRLAAGGPARRLGRAAGGEPGLHRGRVAGAGPRSLLGGLRGAARRAAAPRSGLSPRLRLRLIGVRAPLWAV